MHAFVQDNPGILDTITSDLAQGTLFESPTGHSDSKDANYSAGSNSNSSSARKRKQTMAANAARDKLLKTIADSSATNAASNEEKSKSIRLAALTQTQSTMQSMLETAKKQKKDTLKSLKEHFFSNKPNTLNTSRVQIIVNHLGKRQQEKEKVDAATEGQDEDNEDDPFQLSQETTQSIRQLDGFDSIVGFANDYNDANKQIKLCEKVLSNLASLL